MLGFRDMYPGVLSQERDSTGWIHVPDQVYCHHEFFDGNSGLCCTIHRIPGMSVGYADDLALCNS